MEQLAILQAVVTADIVDFETKLNKVKSSASDTAGFLSGLGDFGQKLTMGLTLPLVGAGIAVAKVGSDFDAEMRNINSLLQLSETQFDAFGKSVNEYASTSVYGANETADALYTIVSAGIGVKDTADAMTLLGASTLVAASGRDELERTTMAMIAMHETFGDLMTDAEIGDTIANMVQIGAGPLSSYTQNMAKVAPAADMLGLSFNELGSDIAQLSLIYGNGSKPMTAMGMLMSNLIKPNLTLQAGFKDLGVKGFKELTQRAGGLNEALFMLKDSMTEFDFNKSFSKTGFEAVAILTNDIDKTREAYSDFMATVDGAADRAMEEQMKSFDAAFSKAKASIEGVAVVLSDTLLPILAPIFDGVSMLANAFITADPSLQSMVVVFGLIAAAAGPVIWAVGSILAVLNPFTVGIGLLAAAVSTNMGGIKDKLVGAAEAAFAAFKPLADILESVIELMSYKFDPLKPQDLFGPVDLKDAADQVFGAESLPDVMGMIKVDKPSSLWDVYKKQGYDKQFSWHEFMKKVTEGGWDGKAITPESIINIGDPDTMRGPAMKAANAALDIVQGTFGRVFGNEGPTPVGGSSMFTLAGLGLGTEGALESELETALSSLWANISAAIPGMLQGVASAIGSGAGFIGNAVVDMFRKVWGFFTSGQANGGPDILGFVDTNIVQPFLSAFNSAWPTMETELGGLWNMIRGWFDEKVGAGLDFLASLFTGTEASGGETPIYTAVKAILTGDIYGAIDAVIPGAGTHLQNLIGGDWGAKVGGAFPQIEEGLGVLIGKFGKWFMDDAVPTVARSIGFFMGRIGGLLYGGFKDLIGGIGKGGIDAGGALSDFGEAVGVPFASGLQEGLGSTGEVDMTDTFKGFGEQLVSSLAGAVGLASLAMGAWGLATGGIFNGLKMALMLPTWFATTTFTIAGQIATGIAGDVATKMGQAATWTGLATGILKGIGALPTLVVTGLTWATTAAEAIGAQIVAGLGLSTAYAGIAGKISLGLQAIKVITLTIVDFAGVVAGAIAQPILAQMGMTATWATLTTTIGAGISLLTNMTTIAITNAAAWASAIAAPMIAKISLGAAWGGLTAAITAGLGLAPVPVAMALSSAATWAASIAAPILAALGASAVWAGITATLWAVAAPLLLVAGAIVAVKAAVDNFNNTTAAGALTAQVAVKTQIKLGLTEKELEDQVFASIQSSPLGDIGARLFYTNFKAQIAGDVEFTPQEITIPGGLPTITDQTLPVEGTIEWTWANPDSTPLFTGGTEGYKPLDLGGDMLAPIVLQSDNFIDPNTPAEVKALGDETIAVITATTAQFGEQVTGMIADGTLDPEMVNQNFLVPLGTYWEAAFGATGTMATATTGFATTFTTQFGLIDTAFVTTVTGATTQLTLLTDTLTMKKDEISTIMSTLGDSTSTSLTKFGTSFQTTMTQVGMYVTNMAAKVHGLITEIQSLGNMTGGGGGGGGIDGSHETGLDYVPHDGYVAELHKGEMVLTAEQATKFRTPQTSISNTKNSTSNSSTDVVVNVYGGDTDKLLAELKRRGVKIGR